VAVAVLLETFLAENAWAPLFKETIPAFEELSAWGCAQKRVFVMLGFVKPLLAPPTR
jgi:hypothetical protein